MEPVVLIMTTVGSEEQGIQIAQAVVERGQAACVNIVKHIRSIYRWKGEIWDDDEYLLLIKTRESLFPAVRDTIRSLHSYELPEVICVPANKVDERVQGWIMDTTVQKERPQADKPSAKD
ncbi:MAG: divalent-cation tolerance protein CutA [Acidobacteria bacterium]|jgi:periplasmic divalent cation tolerance protein|nr:divalent-cation tolerance protein CutA [Acidobacteriota bacterium]